MALAFPETSEQPHFEKISFRVGRKIFATFDAKNNRACLKLSAIDQDVFSLFDKTMIYPVSNKWGKQGWTFVELKQIKKDLFSDVLKHAYCEVAPQKLAALIAKKEV